MLELTNTQALDLISRAEKLAGTYLRRYSVRMPPCVDFNDMVQEALLNILETDKTSVAPEYFSTASFHTWHRFFLENKVGPKQWETYKAKQKGQVLESIETFSIEERAENLDCTIDELDWLKDLECEEYNADQGPRFDPMKMDALYSELDEILEKLENQTLKGWMSFEANRYRTFLYIRGKTGKYRLMR